MALHLSTSKVIVSTLVQAALWTDSFSTIGGLQVSVAKDQEQQQQQEQHQEQNQEQHQEQQEVGFPLADLVYLGPKSQKYVSKARVVYPNGDRYEGEGYLRDGSEGQSFFVRHGEGELIYDVESQYRAQKRPDVFFVQDKYSGKWKDDKESRGDEAAYEIRPFEEFLYRRPIQVSVQRENGKIVTGRGPRFTLDPNQDVGPEIREVLQAASPGNEKFKWQKSIQMWKFIESKEHPRFPGLTEAEDQRLSVASKIASGKEFLSFEKLKEVLSELTNLLASRSRAVSAGLDQVAAADAKLNETLRFEQEKVEKIYFKKRAEESGFQDHEEYCAALGKELAKLKALLFPRSSPMQEAEEGTQDAAEETKTAATKAKSGSSKRGENELLEKVMEEVVGLESNMNALVFKLEQYRLLSTLTRLCVWSAWISSLGRTKSGDAVANALIQKIHTFVNESYGKTAAAVPSPSMSPLDEVRSDVVKFVRYVENGFPEETSTFKMDLPSEWVERPTRQEPSIKFLQDMQKQAYAEAFMKLRELGLI